MVFIKAPFTLLVLMRWKESHYFEKVGIATLYNLLKQRLLINSIESESRTRQLLVVRM